MQDNKPDLALSRTFRLVGGELSAADQAEQWAQVLNHTGKKTIGPGEIIDAKYQVIALVGVGGMGSVYRVKHQLLGKEMALKTFNTSDLSADAWQRFQREAVAIAKLTHLNIVQVFDFGIGRDNVPFYTMELLAGQSLSERIYRESRLEMADAIPIFIAAANGLSHAHKLNIVHRDIKPANIFLSQSAGNKTIVKVVDFGIAKLATVQDYDEQTQTDSGIVFGSPLYMSPEQSMGEPTDHRTDIYSFGCTVFETLTGKPPFLGENAFETISMHHHKKPPHMVDVCPDMKVSQAMERMVTRLLEKDVQKRYQSFDHVLADLHNIPAADLVRSGIKKSVPVAGDKERREQEDTEGTQADSQETAQHNTGSIAAANRRLLYFGVASMALLAVAFATAYYLIFLQHRAPSASRSQAAMVAVKGANEDKSSAAKISRLPQYFSTILPDGIRVFDFPSDPIIGTIVLRGQPERLANTVIRVKPGQDVEFRPSNVVCNNPELFRKFHPDDIDCLNCGAFQSGYTPDADVGRGVWGPRQLDIVTQALTGVSRLDLSGSEIDGDCIKYLNRLRGLCHLIVSDTKLTGHDLIKLHRLLQLRFLEMNHISGAMQVVNRLPATHCCTMLKIEDCGLKDDDMKVIGGLTELIGLSVQHNKITLQGLKYLAPLTKIENLEIAGEPIGPEAIAVLSTFKNLHALSFSSDNWSGTQKVQLQLALPHCSISYKDRSGKLQQYTE